MQDISGDSTETRKRVANDWAMIENVNAPIFLKIQQTKERAIAEFKTITFTSGPPECSCDFTDRVEDELIAQSKVNARNEYLEYKENWPVEVWNLDEKQYWSIYDNLFVTRIIDFDRIAYSGKQYDAIRHQPKADAVASVIFAQLDRNVACEIIKQCSMQTIGRLAQINKWWYKLCTLDTVWTNVFEKFKEWLDVHDKMPESLKLFNIRMRDQHGRLTSVKISETTIKNDAEKEKNAYLKTKRLLTTLIKKHPVKPFYHEFGANFESVEVDNYMFSSKIL